MRLAEDFKAYSMGSLGKGISTLLFNPCFHSTVLYRFSCWLYRLRLKPLAKIVWYWNRTAFHVDLDFRSRIDGGFRMIHGLNVVIGCEVVAGKNFTVYQGVTLGGSCDTTKVINGITTGQPVLGDNVIIYTDAKLLGPVYIPDGTRIKAGKLVAREEDLQHAAMRSRLKADT